MYSSQFCLDAIRVCTCCDWHMRGGPKFYAFLNKEIDSTSFGAVCLQLGLAWLAVSRAKC